MAVGYTEVEVEVEACGTCSLGGNSKLFLANCSIGKMLVTGVRGSMVHRSN